MRTELTKRLLDRFPMYSDYYRSMQQTCMCWGFDHGDGWFDIIWQLSLAIEDLLKPVVITEVGEHRGKTLDHAFKVEQVKEKFGTLRFYCPGLVDKDLDARLQHYIHFAKLLTEHTCEACGKPGKIGGHGWISVRCRECDPERYKEEPT